MAFLLFAFLASASLTAAQSSHSLNPKEVSTPKPALSLLSPSKSQPLVLLNSTLDVSAPFTVCYGPNKEPDLEQDQCMEALVNSEFASLPPTQMLEFASRSSPSPAGQIGLPRRYLSCV